MTNSYKLSSAYARFFGFVCCLIALTGLWSTSMFAQVGPPTVGAGISNGYSSATTTGAYTAITGGTQAYAGAAVQTDGVTLAVPIGFTFRYNTRNYTTVRISNNGFITFGANPPLANTYTALSANTNPNYDGAIAGFAVNLGAAAVGSPEVRYETVGIAPNREFVVQYQDVRASAGSAAQRMNFQIRLAETTNVVRIVYGTCASGTVALTGQVGLRGGENSDVNNRTGTNWTTLTAGTANSSTVTLGTTGGTTIPASGLTFTLTPGTWVSPAGTYAAIGAPTETFDALWVNQNSTQDSPGASWRTWPPRGDNAMRRSDNSVSGFTSTTGWSSTGGTQTITAPSTGQCARWHEWDVSTGTSGTMDYFIDLSTNTGTTEIAFDLIKPAVFSGGLQMQLSTDGGATFSNLGAAILAGPVGQTVTRQTTATSATSVVRFLFSSTFTNDWYIDNFRTYLLCSGTPTAGTGENASPAAITTCAGNSVTVSLGSGFSTGPGITYQWQSSATTGGPYSNISGATSTSYVSPILTSDTYFRCVVTCTGSGLTANTSEIAVLSNFPFPTLTASPAFFCGTGGTSLITSNVTTNPGYTFTWAFVGGSGFITGPTSPSTTDNPNFVTLDMTGATEGSVGNVRVTADDGAGCVRQVNISVGVYGFPSLTLAATPDTVCVGSTSALTSGLTAGNFSVNSITPVQITPPGSATYLMTNGIATTPLTGGSLDDGGWGGIPIGFNFNYFGNTFTTLGAGTNGLLMFGTIPGYGTGPGQLGQFTFSGPPVFPNVGNPANVIALLAADMQMANSTTGSISYWTQGFAPNRVFVINYQQVHGWSNNPAATVQCKLYETTGIVDIVIVSKTFTNTATVGLQDQTRTIGAVAPGRSGTWTVTVPEAWRFTPPANYNTAWTPAANVVNPDAGLNVFSGTTEVLNTPGTQTFTFTATQLTTGCVGGGPVTVEVLPLPGLVSSSDLQAYGSVLGAGSAGASPFTNLCGDQTVTYQFTGTLVGAEVVKWYNAATGGTLLATGSTYTTGSLTPGTYNVWAEFNNGTCQSASRTQFTVTMATPPPITIALLGPELDLVRCDASGFTTIYTELVDANSVNDPNYTYTWTPGDANAIIFNQIAIPSPGALDWHTDTTTVGTVTAFDAVTGCQTDTTLAFSVYAFPVVTPTATSDTICVGDSTLLNSGVAVGTFGVTCRSVNIRPAVGPTTLISNPDGATPTYNVAPTSSGLAFDDAGWGGIPIGFAFDYFGTTFTTINVGTNGTATFGPYNAAQVEQFFFSSWPSLSNPANCIAVIATDLRFNTIDAAGAQIRYWTEGVAPNRVFVLEYLDVPGWSGTVGNQWVQLQLFETTGVVEIHAEEATYVGGKSIALQDGTQTIGSAAPRCNLAPGNFWNNTTATIPAAFSEAWKFQPPVSYSFDWGVDAQISGSDNNATAMAVPTTGVPANVVYSLVITDNVSNCVGAPVNVDVEVIAIPTAPNVTGYGSFSDVDGVNTVNFCGDQDVLLYVSDALNPNWTAKYYNAAVGGTLLFTADPYNDTTTVAGLTANDTVWVSIDNGFCEGVRRQVNMLYQVPDPITISFNSGQAIVCGPGTFSADLNAASTAPYTYTWNPGNIVGANTGTINYSNTVVYQVDGTDGYCFNSAQQSLSRFDFPALVADAQFDSVCLGNTSVLSAVIPPAPYTVTSIGYSPIPLASPTFLVQNAAIIVPMDVPSLDDGGWFNVPLGFTYDFFGNNYTTCHVSTNGNIQFGNTANFSTSFSPGAIPSTLVPNNYVGALWTDWNFNNAGSNSIRYETTGTSPNRVFSIQFDGTRFGGAANSRYTSIIELYEANGTVKVHTQQCSDAVTAAIITGVEDLTGTIGSAAPGRNGDFSAVWPANFAPEGWLFSPPATYATNWVISNNPGSIVGPTNTPTITAQPAAPSTTYQLIVTDNLTTCDNSTNQQTFLTVSIASAPPIATYSASPALGTSGGVVTTHTMSPNADEVGGDVYVWTITPATFNFVNGTNANSREPEVQFTAPGTYGVQLSISRCGGAPVVFSSPTVFNIAAVYCFPSFSNGCLDGDLVDDVTIKNPQNVTIMEHLNTGCGGNATGYNNFTGTPVNGVTTCTMFQGSTYQITVDGGGIFNEYYGVWVDVNNDGDFADAGECMGFTPTASLLATFDIGVPSENVTFGLRRMRVITSFGALNAGSFCINGTWGETHDYFINIAPPVISNDIPTNAVNVVYSSNVAFPNCVNLSGNTTLATNSPESAGSNGNDVWYRVTAQSTGLSITLTSSSMDDYIALYTKDLSGNYNLVAGGTENSSSGNGDFERLNIGGLTAGTVYYISVGSVNNASSGAFTLCVQHLLKSWPTFVAVPGGIGHDACAAYKATYRGTPAQGATYNFTFTGTGGGAPVGPASITGTNGLITLSNPALVPNIQYNGIYNCQVDMVYNLLPSAGADAPITVLGSVADPNATGVTVRPYQLQEVRLSQRCNASLLRSNFLIGNLVAGNGNPCGVINYTFEFQQVVSCSDGTTVGAPVEYTTPGATPFLPLGNLPLLGSLGAWDVRIRANYNYGNGPYGPVQRIQVANTAASETLADTDMVDDVVKTTEFGVAANLFPNPNTGEMVNLNVSGVESDNVFVRVLDAMGRVVYSNRFTVEGSLNTIVTFAQPLASGIYNVEFTVDGDVITERMIVTKQ